MGEDNSILYLFGLSMQDKGKGNHFLNLIKNNVKQKAVINIILLHDAVIGSSSKVKNNEIIEELLNIPLHLHTVIPDLKARGIKVEDVHPKIDPIEYEELVELFISNSRIVSWL